MALAAEWIKIPDGQGNLQKVWIRDSQARRDIATLNTAVSGKQAALSTAQMNAVNSGITAAKVATYDAITVPTKTSDLTNDSGFITASAVPDPSSAAPAMDGTAAAGSSTDYARADHVHPSDTSKADVSAIPTATSQLTNDSGFISLSTLQPTAYTAFTPYQSRCTVDAGGYVKIGNIVFIDMVITALQASSTSAFVAMLSDVSAIKPLKGANYTILTAVNNTSRTKTTKVMVNTNGGISLCNAAVNEVIYITGCYLAAT